MIPLMTTRRAASACAAAEHARSRIAHLMLTATIPRHAQVMRVSNLAPVRRRAAIPGLLVVWPTIVADRAALGRTTPIAQLACPRARPVPLAASVARASVAKAPANSDSWVVAGCRLRRETTSATVTDSTGGSFLGTAGGPDPGAGVHRCALSKRYAARPDRRTRKSDEPYCHSNNNCAPR